MSEPVKSSLDLTDRVEHGFADHGGVKIHYASLGEGPLIVMIHGFPDFWYTWRYQIEALSDQFQCVAIDLRGYNKSDKPHGQEQYDTALLVDDVVAVIEHLGRDKAIVIGHDWGGMVAWQVAMNYPEMVKRLVICNLPHPRGLARELVHNPDQQRNSQYARDFQREGAYKELTAEGLAQVVARGDPAVQARYAAAFEASDFEAMLNYYKQNYPREPYTEDTSPLVKVKAPVLMFHGLDDWALLPGALNGTWEWLDRDLTLVTIPGAGHWVHHDAAEKVSATIKSWLNESAFD